MPKLMSKELLFEAVCTNKATGLRWHSGFWFIEFIESNPDIAFRFVHCEGDEPGRWVTDCFIVNQTTGEIHSVDFLSKHPIICRELLGLAPIEIMPDETKSKQGGLGL